MPAVEGIFKLVEGSFNEKSTYTYAGTGKALTE